MDAFSSDIQSAGIQVMESTYNVANSRKFNVIKSNFEFLISTALRLREGLQNPQYLDNIKAAIEHYQKMYHDRQPEEYQLAILKNPNDFNYIDFYCRTLTNGMNRFTEEQFEEINSLKRETTKAKRIVDGVSLLIKAQGELESKCSSCEVFPVANDAFEKMKDKLNDILK